MSRRMTSFSQVIKQERDTWMRFGRALSREAQEAFDGMFECARLSTHPSTTASVMESGMWCTRRIRDAGGEESHPGNGCCSAMLVIMRPAA
jgi:hypothetical protein